MTINAVCRKGAINRNHLAPLVLVFTHDRRRKFVGLGISEALVHWDFDKQQPTADCPDRAEIQFQITSKIREYEKKIKKLEVLEIPVTFDTLFEQNGKRINCMVGEYFKQIIERLEKVEKYSSASKHKVTLVLVSQFRSVNMRFDELDLTYLREFEIFLSQKGNVNNSCNYAAFQYCRLYLIEILHQTTTIVSRSPKNSPLYLIEILHQTTTRSGAVQHRVALYLIEILHQTTTVVAAMSFVEKLYLIEILHQTTTERSTCRPTPWLYLIEILHQTTTRRKVTRETPQLYLIEILHQTTTAAQPSRFCYQLYLIEILHQTTTPRQCVFCGTTVVSYRNSTSNHNFAGGPGGLPSLYLIEILHQTTTTHRA